MATYIVDDVGFREVLSDEPLAGFFRLYMEGSNPITAELAAIWVPDGMSDVDAKELLRQWKIKIETDGNQMPDFAAYNMKCPGSGV